MEAFAHVDGSAVAVLGHLRATQAETGSCQLIRCRTAKGGTSYKVVLILIWTDAPSFIHSFFSVYLLLRSRLLTSCDFFHTLHNDFTH